MLEQLELSGFVDDNQLQEWTSQLNTGQKVQPLNQDHTACFTFTHVCDGPADEEPHMVATIGETLLDHIIHRPNEQYGDTNLDKLIQQSNGEFIGASQPAQSSRTDGVQTGVPTPVGRVDSSMQTGGIVGAGKRVVTKEVQAKVRATEPTLYKII